MLTAGLGAAVPADLQAPTILIQRTDAAPIAANATDAVTIAAVEPGAATNLAYQGDWIVWGADAQFGPASSVIHGAHGDAVGGTFEAISARPGPVFDAHILPAFDGPTGVRTLPAFDAQTLPAFDAQILPAFDGPAGEVRTLPAFDAQTLPAYDSPTGDVHILPAFDVGGGFERQAELDAAFQKQFENMQAIQDKSEVTPRLMATLRKAREKVAGEAGEPDATLVQNFRNASDAVEASGTFTAEQQAQIKDGYTALLRSAGVSDAAIAELFAALDAVKAASHVDEADLKTLAEDRAAVQVLLDAQSEYFAQHAPVAIDGGMARASILPAYDVAATTEPVMAVTGLAGGGAGAGVDPADLAATSQPVAITSQAGDQPVTISAPAGGVGVGVGNRLLGRPTPAGFQKGGLEVIRQNGGLNLVRGGVRRPALNAGGSNVVRNNGNLNVNTVRGGTIVSPGDAARNAGRLRQTGFSGMRISGRSATL